MRRPTKTHHRVNAAVGVGAAVVLTVLLVVLDLSLDTRAFGLIGLCGAAPMLTAVLAGPRSTAASALFATAAVYVRGLITATTTDPFQMLLLGVTVGLGAVAVAAAELSRRRDAQLTAMTNVARVAEQTVVRPVPAHVAGLRVAVLYASANRMARVGGDCYEVLDTPAGVRALIADARGKGLPAVRFAAHTVAAFREAAYDTRTLSCLAAVMDRSVTRAADTLSEGGDVSTEDFVTAALVEVAGDQIRVATCGHPAPLLLRGGNVRSLDLKPVPPLGLGLGGAPEVCVVTAEPGDRILMFTDGLAEARHGDVFFDVPTHAALALRDPDPEAALRALSRAATRHARGRLDDDMALVLLEVPRP